MSEIKLMNNFIIGKKRITPALSIGREWVELLTKTLWRSGEYVKQLMPWHFFLEDPLGINSALP